MSDGFIFLLTLVGPALSGAIAYGVSVGTSRARINGLRDRVDKLESTRYLTREEYEARHKDLILMVRALAGKPDET